MHVPAGLRIGVTAGCPAGIGPEVVAGALSRATLDDESVTCVFLGPPELLQGGAALAGIAAERLPGSPDRVRLLAGAEQAPERSRVVECEHPAGLELRNVSYGRPDEHALHFQRNALVLAAEAARAGRLQAIVTGPVRKKALSDVLGRSFPGQTELLHHFLAADDDEPLMCFTGGPFVLGLVTAHVPLREVSGAVTPERLRVCLARLKGAAQRVMDVAQPRLAVLGVNPHAGEGGLLGDEEARVLEPVLREARGEGLVVEGPLPADGFFASLSRRQKDAMPHGVLAMHHDQGLAPYKMLGRGKGVNLTWGLTVPRTSPDHGTADDIAGRGVADASSTTAALELAAQLLVRS